MDIKIENGVVIVKEGGMQRRVGNLRTQGDDVILRVTRDLNKHLVRKYNAYGFARKLIEQDFFNYLQLVERDGAKENVYLISRIDALSEGRFYKAEGFEEQVLIPRPVLRAKQI